VGTEKVNILYNLSDNIITFGGAKNALENRVGEGMSEYMAYWAIPA
jgi:hypothetical protein